MNLHYFALFLLLAIPASAGQSFPALLADKPSAEHTDKLMLFGQFVGSWAYDAKEYHDDGSHLTGKGTIDFQWVLKGRAVQDVWTETERSDSSPKVCGTTVRFYDPATDTWKVTWMDPVNVAVKTLVARKVGSEIVLEGKSSKGDVIHWIFSDIGPNSFRWHAEILQGNTWRTYEDLQVRRIR